MKKSVEAVQYPSELRYVLRFNKIFHTFQLYMTTLLFNISIEFVMKA